MDKTTQRILAETYTLSRIRYAAEIFYTYIAQSKREEIERTLRTIIRYIHNISLSAPIRYMEQITNHIPLGIKALVAGIKLKEKMEYYFPKDIMEYENHFGMDVWEKMTGKYSQVLGKVKKEVYKIDFTRKEKK